MKHRSGILVTILAVMLCTAVQARPRPGFGIEWGGGASFLETHHFNYNTQEGRINDVSTRFLFHAQAYVLADFNLHITDRIGIALVSGYQGIFKDREMIPLDLRLKFCPKGFSEDGPVLFAEGGAGFPVIHKQANVVAALGAVGGGFRLALKDMTGIDFTLAIRGCLDHPDVYDEVNGLWIDSADVKRNNAAYFALTIGVALNF